MSDLFECDVLCAKCHGEGITSGPNGYQCTRCDGKRYVHRDPHEGQDHVPCHEQPCRYNVAPGRGRTSWAEDLEEKKQKKEGTSKHDAGKAKWHLMPFDALKAVVSVLEYGAKKYSAENWRKGLEWSRLSDAALRHMFAWQGGEDTDPESGVHHLAHVACDCLFLIWYSLHGVGTDDRFRYGPRKSDD